MSQSCPNCGFVFDEQPPDAEIYERWIAAGAPRLRSGRDQQLGEYAQSLPKGHMAAILRERLQRPDDVRALTGLNDPIRRKRSIAPARPLSDRQNEIWHLALGGLSNQEIGRRLNVTAGVVANHVYKAAGILSTNLYHHLRGGGAEWDWDQFDFHKDGLDAPWRALHEARQRRKPEADG